MLKNKNFILLIIIILLLLIGIVFYFYNFSTPGLKVRVLRDNEIIDELSLNENTQKTYESNGEENTLVIKDGKVDVIEANCQNQICVDSYPISNIGETIVCLPHRLIFEIIEN